jgi:SAM-dependent methyltransferase
VAEDNVTFSFGKNWEQFVRTNFSEERIEIARQHLLGFLDMKDLQGKHFLDIGCGSGIHSLAAFNSNARRIVSFDVDPYSVATTKRIHELYGRPANWHISQGSILDHQFICTVEPADIVYSWGVLHHTGKVWQAIKNASTFLNPGSIFYIAIYDKTPDTPYWIDIKKKYNRSTRFGKKRMELAYVWRTFFRSPSLSRTMQSISYIRNYKTSRGMEFWTDVKDWLGGWPYEPATLDEVCGFCEGTLGLKRVKVKTGEANIEYLFRKNTA